MDQANNLRSIIKKQNQVTTSNCRIITVTSGKGGVGKSNMTVNLALQFRRQGKRVIIFDADFGLANVEVMFGVIPKYTLADLIFRGRDIKDIITEGPEGVQFISGGSGIAKLVNLDNEQLKRLLYKLSELESMADVIIIDTGAGISSSVLEFVAASPEVILVTTPEPTSITDSYALLKALSMYPGYDAAHSSVMVITNKVSQMSESQNIYEKLHAVTSKFLNINLIYLGAVPQDTSITKSVMKQKPVTLAYPSAGAARALETIGRRLISGERKIPVSNEKKGVLRFFGNVFNRRRF